MKLKKGGYGHGLVHMLHSLCVQGRLMTFSRGGGRKSFYLSKKQKNIYFSKKCRNILHFLPAKSGHGGGKRTPSTPHPPDTNVSVI